MARRTKKRQLKRVNAWAVIVVVLLFSLLMGYLGWQQLYRYEQGILSVYAKQQDGYVQLVLDQINLQKNREDEEIVTNILGTLDTSNSHYWTLSEKNSLIFVKDVLETNRYKGFTTETYYASESANKFLQGLQENRVTHGTIQINAKNYVASGVKFSYNGKEYHMCLLTGADSILDQNDYLSAKITLSLIAMLILAFMVIGGIIIAMLAEKWYRRYEHMGIENRELAATVEQLNHELTKDSMYHTQYMAFRAEALPRLLSKMEEKDVWPLEILLVKCPEGRHRRFFFAEAQVLFDEKTVRVILDDTYLLLLSMQYVGEREESRGRLMRQMEGELVGRKVISEKPKKYLERVFAEFFKEVTADGR